MIIDSSSLSVGQNIEAEICIVGAGPAGITLAREFMHHNVQVCLLESGGFEHDEKTQSLCDGQTIGGDYPPLINARCRQFGGTSHLWEAPIAHREFGWRCLPLDTIDFEQRPWLPYSGWPFSKIDLDPFYERAHQVCQIGPFKYQVEDWQQPSAPSLSFKGDRMITTMSQYASRNPFTQEYPQEIKQAKNITTLLHATVLEIETDQTAQTVTRLKVSSLEGKQFWVSPKVVILAAGGIENARILLLSHQVQKTGLGNQNDLVGRFFMDRPIVSCGMLIPYSHQLFDRTGLYDIREVRGVPVMARVMLTENVMRREKLLNNGAQLFPRPHSYQKNATNSLRLLLVGLRQGKVSGELSSHLANILHGIDYVTAAAFWSAVRQIPGLRRGDWSYLDYEKRRFSMFEVIYQIEQAPHPNNRVTLSNQHDCLGQNKTELHWRLNDIDLQTIQKVKEIWAEEFSQSGLGQLQLETELKFEKLAMHHHMGTTRMHDNPKQGVVDANCRVHSLTNLFITGSSVFPTAGYANPTLTIIALALKLADHVKTLF